MTAVATYSRQHAPETLCLLRLSALGDITHVLPTLRTLQKHWPNTKISWIIGKSEYPLVQAIDNVHFIVFDKNAGLFSYPSRAGPYQHQQSVVNKYPQALLKYNDKTSAEALWGDRIKNSKCMSLISVGDVIQKISLITEKPI